MCDKAMRKMTMAEQAEALLREAIPTGDCLICTRSPSQHAPQVKVGGTPIYAHRIIWMHKTGEALPPKIHLHHRCENGRCLNIAHMEPLTSSAHGKVTNPHQDRCSVHGIPYAKRDARGWGMCVQCRREASRRWRQRAMST